MNMRGMSDEVVTVRLDAKQLKEGFASVMKIIHADIIFEEEELPIGKVVKDQNHKYVMAHTVFCSLKDKVYIPAVCK